MARFCNLEIEILKGISGLCKELKSDSKASNSELESIKREIE